MPRLLITRSWDPSWLDVRVEPFHEETVEFLRSLPRTQRTYDPKMKSWRVASYLRHLLDDWAQGLERDEERQRRAPADNSPVTLTEALVTVFVLLPDAMRRPVKRALLQAVHPDVGGDHDTAVALNRALERVAV